MGDPLSFKQNGAEFVDDIFKCIFFNKSFVFCNNFHLFLFLRVQLTINQHWFRLWIGAGQVIIWINAGPVTDKSSLGGNGLMFYDTIIHPRYNWWLYKILRTILSLDHGQCGVHVLGNKQLTIETRHRDNNKIVSEGIMDLSHLNQWYRYSSE